MSLTQLTRRWARCALRDDVDIVVARALATCVAASDAAASIQRTWTGPCESIALPASIRQNLQPSDVRMFGGSRLAVPFNYGLVLVPAGSDVPVQEPTIWMLPNEDFEGVKVPDAESPVVFLLSEQPMAVTQFNASSGVVLARHDLKPGDGQDRNANAEGLAWLPAALDRRKKTPSASYNRSD
jgi:hypothetical protein